jgi:hypothetical protein
VPYVGIALATPFRLVFLVEVNVTISVGILANSEDESCSSEPLMLSGNSRERITDKVVRYSFPFVNGAGSSCRFG